MKADMPVFKTVPGDGPTLNTAVLESAGPALICIHGLTANCRCFDMLLPALRPGRRVVIPDLRGRGRSGKPDTGYDIERHCSDLRRLMDGLGLARASILGHSLGAAIGVAFAARYPEAVDRLILLDGGGQLDPERLEKVTEAIRPALARLDRVFPSPEDYLAMMKQSPALRPWNDVIENYFRYELEPAAGGWTPAMRRANMQEEMDNLARTDLAACYPQIMCPVLILAATEGLLSPGDTLLPPPVLDSMLAAIRVARAVTLEGTNHYSILFQPNPERDRAIRDFLAE